MKIAISFPLVLNIWNVNNFILNFIKKWIEDIIFYIFKRIWWEFNPSKKIYFKKEADNVRFSARIPNFSKRLSFSRSVKSWRRSMNFHNKRLDTMCVLGEEDISITFEKIKKIDIIYS